MEWEYSPAPESSAIADIKDRYLPFIDGAFKEGSGEDRDTINPGTGDRLSTVSTVDAADVDRAVSRPPRVSGLWSPMPGAERGKYLFRIARGIAERSRELAVVETLDNGKPIKETRDFDARRCAALLLSRWLGRQAATSRPGTRAATAGCRPGHPLELSAADGSLEDRTGARLPATPS